MEMTDGVTGRVLGGSRACGIGAERQVGFGGNLSHPARVALHMRGTKPYANCQGAGRLQNSN